MKVMGLNPNTVQGLSVSSFHVLPVPLSVSRPSLFFMPLIGREFLHLVQNSELSAKSARSGSDQTGKVWKSGPNNVKGPWIYMDEQKLVLHTHTHRASQHRCRLTVEALRSQSHLILFGFRRLWQTLHMNAQMERKWEEEWVGSSFKKPSCVSLVSSTQKHIQWIPNNCVLFCLIILLILSHNDSNMEISPTLFWHSSKWNELHWLDIICDECLISV